MAADGHGSEAALPWARPTLAVGTLLEVDLAVEEGATYWVEAEVAEVHGDHQYTLLVELADDHDGCEEDGEDEQLGSEGGPGGQQDGSAAVGSATAGGAPAGGQEEGSGEYGEMRVIILGDGLLEVVDSDGSSSGSGSEPERSRHRWRPSATSPEELFARAFLNMAEARAPQLRPGTVLPSAADLGALAAQGLKEFVAAAVAKAEERGQNVVQVGDVLAAMSDMGLPQPPQFQPPPPQQQEQQPPKEQ